VCVCVCVCELCFPVTSIDHLTQSFGMHTDVAVTRITFDLSSQLWYTIFTYFLKLLLSMLNYHSGAT